MLKLLLFYLYSNPWSYRFHQAFRNSVLSIREVDQRAGYIMDKVTADFLHQADLKSLNSDQSLTNLIPDIHPLHQNPFGFSVSAF